jgi:hydrogenase maturation protease
MDSSCERCIANPASRLLEAATPISNAAVASDREPGSVLVSRLNEMPDYSALHTASAHDTSLQNALKLGRAMDAKLPEEVMVVGITTNRVYDFSEELSVPVAKAVPEAAKTVLDLLRQ